MTIFRRIITLKISQPIHRKPIIERMKCSRKLACALFASALAPIVTAATIPVNGDCSTPTDSCVDGAICVDESASYADPKTVCVSIEGTGGLGPPGQTGIQGVPGPAGPPGRDGRDGLAGASGIQGPAGNDGVCNANDCKKCENAVEEAEKLLSEMKAVLEEFVAALEGQQKPPCQYSPVNPLYYTNC